MAKKITSKTMFNLWRVLFVFACLLWASVLVIPFLPLSVGAKASAVAAVIIIGEIAFWLSIALMGKEAYNRHKHKLNPKNWKK